MMHDAPRLPVLCDDLVVPENRESGAWTVSNLGDVCVAKLRQLTRCILLVPKLDSNEATKISEDMLWSMFDRFDPRELDVQNVRLQSMITRDNKSSSPVVQKRHVCMTITVRLLYLLLIYGILDCFNPRRCFPNHIWHTIFALAPTPAQTRTLTKNKLGYSSCAILRMTP